MSALSKFMAISEVAELLRFTVTAKNPDSACLQWLRRQNVPTLKRGRLVLVERAIVEAMLEPENA